MSHPVVMGTLERDCVSPSSDGYIGIVPDSMCCVSGRPCCAAARARNSASEVLADRLVT